VALEAAGLEHPPRRQLVLWILEDAAERPTVRRLRRLPLRVQVAHVRLDLVRRASVQEQLGLDDDLPVPQVGTSVRQPELVTVEPAGAVRGRNERTLEDGGEVAAVRAGVHPDAAADRPGNRARELEAAEPGRAGLVERDGIRGAASGSQRELQGPDRGKLALEVENERVDAVVGDEEIRTEADHRDVLAAAQQSLELADRGRLRELARRASGAERRVARKLHRHARSSSKSGATRSTSPAPRVTTTSPGRAQDATIRAAASGSGVQPMRMPGRTAASSSTISLPSTPSIGCSRAG